MQEEYSAIRSIVQETMADFEVPGITVVVTHGNMATRHLIAGTDATGYPLAMDTLYPVASLSKLAVALAVLRLVDRGVVGLDDAVVRYLPDATLLGPDVTLRTLLAHTSGLPAHYIGEEDLYERRAPWPHIAEACLETPPETAPHRRVQYSGTGYSLLALIVERVVGRAFPSALAALVLEPLGIEGYLGVEPPRRPANIELGTSPFTGTPLEFYNSPHFRSLGEPAAGLLTTADGVIRLIRAFRGVPADFLSPPTVSAAIIEQTGGLGGGVRGWFELPRCPWGLGPALHGTYPDMIPSEASATSFGHQGASGCFVWCDPERDVAWAILGTRIADNGWCEDCFAPIGSAILAER